MSKKKKIIISVCVCVTAVLLLVASLLLVFLLKPQTANEVTVEASEYQIFVKTEIKQSERTYKFKFESNSSIKEYDSESHVMDITPLLWSGELELGRTYDVSVCMVEPSGILAGEYSKTTTFVPVLRLANPNVTFDEDTDLITISEVNGADYYNIYYYDGSNQIKTKTAELTFDVTQIKGGERSIYVTAGSDHFYFLESNKSQTIETTVVHQIAPFRTAHIDLSYRIHIYSSEPVDEVLIYESGVLVGTLRISDYVFSNNEYIMSASVKSIYGAGKKFTIAPKGDAFNVYNGEPIDVDITI